MPDIYEVEKDGFIYEVEAGSEAEALAEVERQSAAPAPQAAMPEPVPASLSSPWMIPPSTIAGDPDLNKFERSVDPGLGVVQMIGNVPQSAWNFAKATGEFLEDPAGNLARSLPNIPGHIAERYGSLDQALNTAITDPIGVYADLRGGLEAGRVGRTAVRAGGSAAARGARNAAASTLETAAKYPVTAGAVAGGLPGVIGGGFFGPVGSAAGGVTGAVVGGFRGLMEGPQFSRTLQQRAQTLRGVTPERPGPGPVPGARIVPRTPPPTLEETLTSALKETMAPESVELAPSHPLGGEFTTPTRTTLPGRLVPGTPAIPMESSLTATLREAMAPEATELLPSHPVGGGFTTPTVTTPPPGRLTRGAPGPTLEQALTSAIEEGRFVSPEAVELMPSHPAGGTFTTPPANAAGRLVPGAGQTLEDALVLGLEEARGPTVGPMMGGTPPTGQVGLSSPVGGGYSLPGSVPPELLARGNAYGLRQPRPMPSHPPTTAPMVQEIAARTPSPQTAPPLRPRDFLERDVASINAMEVKNLGPAKYAGESYEGLRLMLEDAVKRGDMVEASEIAKRIRQRRHQTAEGEARAAKGAKK